MSKEGKFRKTRKKIVFNHRGLILCEGETEENYFKGLVSQERYRRKFASIDVAIYKPKDHSPVGLINKAKDMLKHARQEKNEYDFIWVVFDKDGHAKISDAFETARNSNPEIKIAFSIPCFEYFVLLHFERTSKPFTKCEEVISEMGKRAYLIDYQKASNIFEILEPQMSIGIENSKWIKDQFQFEVNNGTRIYDLSIYSNIHELVEYLYSIL